MASRTVNDVPNDPLRDAEAAFKRLSHGAGQDIVYHSRRAAWCSATGLGALDYLDAVLKPHRDAGTIPEFNNHAEMVAWVLTLPEPPRPAPPFAIVQDRLDGAMKVQQED